MSCKRCSDGGVTTLVGYCSSCMTGIAIDELERLRKIEEWAQYTRSAIQHHTECGGTNDWLQLAVKRLDEIMEDKK